MLTKYVRVMKSEKVGGRLLIQEMGLKNEGTTDQRVDWMTILKLILQKYEGMGSDGSVWGSMSPVTSLLIPEKCNTLTSYTTVSL